MNTRRVRFSVAALALLLFSCCVPIVQAQGFPGCQLPFDRIKEDRQIDESCGAEGRTQSPNSQAQNTAKNNFCANGSPVEVTFRSFVGLQRAAEANKIPFGSDRTLPDERSSLMNIYTTSDGHRIGEGSLVHFVAFVVDAHYSNVSSGETVNCKLHGKEDNDIHIMLGLATNTPPCSTVTAEMSPHFRPVAWEQIAEASLRMPVRISGQLFFDASHSPCKNGAGPNPQRVSLWEIHPVYNIDVCAKTTLAACSVSDDSIWTPLDKWLSTNEDSKLVRSPLDSNGSLVRAIQ
jgi:hypothetical protein